MCKGSFRQIKSAVYHKAILLLFISLLSITGLHAQQQVSGRVLDAVTKEALVGVTVSSGKSHSGTLTRPDGTFSMLMSSPDTVELNYVGFINKKIAASPGQSLGDIFLDPSDMAMKEVIVSSNVAIERRTPIAVTTIRAAAIEERIGN
jgi:hypothetical protein